MCGVCGWVQRIRGKEAGVSSLRFGSDEGDVMVGIWSCNKQLIHHINLANLTLASQHMLPWEDRLNSSIPGYDPDLLPLGVAEATLLLFNRHASRNGDNIVIWTLPTYRIPTVRRFE